MVLNLGGNVTMLDQKKKELEITLATKKIKFVTSTSTKYINTNRQT